MSRHRIVRSMNYEDEYYDDEDDYSRSLEDNYCISPSTAAQFTWNRERNMNFASYMGVDDVINEVEEDQDDLSLHSSLNDSSGQQAKLNLNDIDQARLNSCLEDIHTILGETVPEPVIVEVIMKNHFNVESSLNELLSQKEVPKSQREPRSRRNRSQDDNDDAIEFNKLLAEIQSLESLPSSEFHAPELLRFKSNPGCEENDYDFQVNLLSQSPHKEGFVHKGTGVTKRNLSSVGPHAESVVSLQTATGDKNDTTTVSLSDLMSQEKSACKTSPIGIPSEKKKDSSSNLSLADLAKQSQVDRGKKQLAGEHKTGLSLASCASNKSNKLCDKKMSDIGKFSLADLARQHNHKASKAEDVEGKKTDNVNCELGQVCSKGSMSLALMAQKHSTQMKTTQKHNIEMKPNEQKDAMSLMLGRDEKTMSKTPPSSVSLSELASKHKSNVHSLLALKMDLNSKSTDGDKKNIKALSSNINGGLKENGKQASTFNSFDKPMGTLSLTSCLKDLKHTSKTFLCEKSVDSSDYLLSDLVQHVSLSNCSTDIPQLKSLSPTFDSSLVSQPSNPGLVLCESFTYKDKRRKRKRKFPNFDCQTQIKKLREIYPHQRLHEIKAFTFSTLSPDDIVKSNQKRAFTRSDKEFKVDFF